MLKNTKDKGFSAINNIKTIIILEINIIIFGIFDQILEKIIPKRDKPQTTPKILQPQGPISGPRHIQVYVAAIKAYEKTFFNFKNIFEAVSFFIQ